MAILCITREVAESLKRAARAGRINIAEMYKMSSEQRRDLFGEYVNEENAQFINTKFEEAMVSTDKNALKKWAEIAFNTKEKKESGYRDVLEKIQDLEKQGLLTPENTDAYLEDLVADKLGVTITSEEAKNIADKSKKLEATSTQRSQFGTPSLEYFQARREMDDYIESITPSSRLKVLSSIIARGTLLASFKSPFINIESNTIQGALKGLERRINNRAIGGANNQYSMDYIKYVNDIYGKTGYDVSRMLTLDGESEIRGEGITTTQGTGTIRAIGRFYEDLIFKKLQGAPDVFFSSVAFADRANIESTKIAMSEGLKGEAMQKRALDIFRDSTAIDPITDEGKAVRLSARAGAMDATYTNKTAYSEFALGIRKLFNLASGDLRVGDQIMPFVKTPANVVGAGIESSGTLVPIDATIRLAKALKSIHKGESVQQAFGDNFKGFSDVMIKAGLGLTFAWLLSNLFKPDDYIGEYPTTEKERQLLLLRNATTNSLRIGGKWVSLDYFGSLGAPLVGMLYAKKYGTNLPSAVWEYYKGVGKQALKIPGFDEFYNLVDSIKSAAPGAKKSVEEEIKDIANFAVSFVRARVIPALVSDIAKGTDTAERVAGSKDAFSQFKAAIPGLRKTLPEKQNIFGDTVKTEGLISTLMFGARVKTVQDDEVIAEMTRLSEAGYMPSLTDIEKFSTKAGRLKEEIGNEKFQVAKKEYSQALRVKIAEVINRGEYLVMDLEDKKSLIEKAKDYELTLMLERYGYKEPEKKKSTFSKPFKDLFPARKKKNFD